MSASRCYQMQNMLRKSPTFCLGCLLDWPQMGFLRFFYFFLRSVKSQPVSQRQTTAHDQCCSAQLQCWLKQ